MVSVPSKLSRWAQPPTTDCSGVVQPLGSATAREEGRTVRPCRRWLREVLHERFVVATPQHPPEPEVVQPAQQQRAARAALDAPLERGGDHVARAAAEGGHGGRIPGHCQQGLQKRAEGRVLALRSDLMRRKGQEEEEVKVMVTQGMGAGQWPGRTGRPLTWSARKRSGGGDPPPPETHLINSRFADPPPAAPPPPAPPPPAPTPPPPQRPTW